MTTPSRYDSEDRVLNALKKRDGVATLGEISTDTGLGYSDTENALRHLLTIYKSHLDVDNEGNLLYQFETTFIRRGETPGRFWYDIKKKYWSVFQFLFKIWIMVMLVGYVAVFILLLIVLIIGAIGASISSDSDDMGDLIGIPFHLLARLLEFMFWIDFYDGGSSRRRPKRKKKKIDKAFYQKTFDFVFGPEQKKDALLIQKRFTQFIMANKGQVSAADWAKISGQSLADAENALTAGVLRYNGDVDFSENGTLIYKFKDLVLSLKKRNLRKKGPKAIWKTKAIAPNFTGNAKGTNRWILGFNAFILISSLVVLFQSAALGALATVGLGFIPFLFSLLFFAIPSFRFFQYRTLEKKIQKENQRRENIRQIYHTLKSEKSILLNSPNALQLVEDFAGEIEEGDRYIFEKLGDMMKDSKEVRQKYGIMQVFGKSVFSSNEDKVSISDFEMEDFDRRLAAELENQSVVIEQEFRVEER